MSKPRFPRYEQMLKLYPKQYRVKYGPQMTQTLADMLDNTDTQLARRTIWAKVALDYPVSVLKTQLIDIGDVMTHETPKYLKGSGLVAGLLVLPFIAALTANALDKVINNHTLYGSWLWRFPALGFWVLWLPAAALCVAAASYLRYMLYKDKQSKVSLIRRAVDIRHIWPVIVPGVLAFGILFMLAFHDSIHCWVQNPAYLVTRYHQTLQCTRDGFLGGRN